MNTNITIELTDEQRADMQRQLTGKNKMITRLELREFVEGVVSGALDCEEVNVQYDGAQAGIVELPSKWADRYSDKPEHWRQGWLRGWNAVGDRSGK